MRDRLTFLAGDSDAHGSLACRFAVLAGPFFLNRVTPFVFGMPFLLAWLVAWIVLTPAIMAVIFWFDPVNREDRQ